MDLMQCTEQARRGDRFAQEQLSRWCLHRAFRFAYAELGAVPNRELLAEEIAGEASLRAVLHLHQFEPGTRFDAWLRQIVRNAIRGLYRREERALPEPLYRRWVHEFLHTQGPELEAFIEQEYGPQAASPHAGLFPRIATDLRRLTYRQFLRLRYDGRAQEALCAVKQHLRSFLAIEWVPLYEPNEAGEWVEVEIPAAEETESAVLQRELVREVNAFVAILPPGFRRLFRWYFLDQLRLTEIAALEGISRWTVHRRLQECAAALCARLERTSFLAEGAVAVELAPWRGSGAPPYEREAAFYRVSGVASRSRSSSCSAVSTICSPTPGAKTLASGS